MRKICQRAGLRLVLSVCAGSALFASTASAGEAGSFFSARATARVDWDTAYVDARGKPDFNDSELRRFGVGVGGHIGTLKYRAVVDPGGLEHQFNRHGMQLRDVWLSHPFGTGTLKIGQFKPAFALEGASGSDVGSFIERPGAVSPLMPGFRKAASWQMAGAHSSFLSSLWRLQQIGAPELAGFGIGARLTFAPQAREGDVRHLGISLAHEHHDHPGVDGAPALRIRARMGAHLSNAIRPTLAEFSAGNATEVDKWSLEYARIHGAWSWQGEFSGAVMEDGREQAHLLAGYSALSWFVSGHSRRYDPASGRFARIKNVSLHAPGWELALRFDHVHGHQHDNRGLDHINNTTSALTLASNWYLGSSFRVMLNLVNSLDRNHLTRTSGRAREIVARAQYDF